MDRTAFLSRVEAYHNAGWRLALINATTVMAAEGEEEGAFELAWGFARDGRPGEGADEAAGTLELIRETVKPGEEVPSVSGFFGSAFLYENELRELFGIDVTGIEVDLKGQLYKTATRIPFSHRAVRERLEKEARS
jgi:Ni,Fe-hydrogenase III component G